MKETVSTRFVATLAMVNIVFSRVFPAARGAAIDNRARLPRPTVPGGRRHRAHHEDAKDTQSQHAHRRVVQPTQVPRQGDHPVHSILFILKFETAEV